jgi:BirA family biotin operon repressor/biotin-[acetyl-CoA-carboxylase] ligase
VPAGEPVTGTAVDIDAGGRLVVQTATGEVPIGAGDVIHVRATEG